MPKPSPMPLLQGTLDMLILRTLIFGPRHGHGIAVTIQRTSAEDLLVDHGSLYPALQRLERQGLHQIEMGHVRAQPARPLLRAHARRPQEADGGNRQVGTDGPRHRTRDATPENRGDADMFWRRRTRLDEEVELHLAEETADNIARGMDPVTARQAALRTFGNVEAAKETAREVDPLYWLDTLWQDIRFAFRLIASNPWVSVTIVATLTVGIALNVSVLQPAQRLLPAPVGEAANRRRSSASFRDTPETYPLRFLRRAAMSQPDYVRYRDSATSLASLAAYRLVGTHAERSGIRQPARTGLDLLQPARRDQAGSAGSWPLSAPR